jgi:hypothetical protein
MLSVARRRLLSLSLRFTTIEIRVCGIQFVGHVTKTISYLGDHEKVCPGIRYEQYKIIPWDFDQDYYERIEPE